jgi:hypothetical protein
MIRYIRTTRECPASQTHPGLYQAIREYFQKHELGDPDTEALMCCETVSQAQDPGRLVSFLDGNPDSVTHLAILLTADWLIWARTGDRSGTSVTGAKLKVIRVKPFVTRRTKDMQLDISGFIYDSKEYVRGSLVIGPDEAAQKLCEMVEEAVLKANPPSKRKFPRWMGG